MKTPKLTLIGAGPGDPDLITLKGLKALKEADIIFYDALVNVELLNYAPANTPKKFVGKRKDLHKFTQDDINQLICTHAFTHGHVVRLKGGDPFVFGRGFEELQAAREHNIPAEYIPGISSSVGVPGLAGIPVTHRAISESFWVITGTTRTTELSKDVYAAAQTDATVVILMGLGKLKEIVEVFQSFHKNDLPVAVIQNGSLPNEKVVLGTIDTIEDIIENEKLGTPAVLVIGEAVRLHPAYPTYMHGLQDILEFKTI